RGHFLRLAPHFAVGAPVRQHDGRPRDARGVRRLHRDARRRRPARLLPCPLRLRRQRHPDRLRTAGRDASGLRVRRADVHLPARRRPSPLISLTKGTSLWISPPPSSLVQVSPSSRWQAWASVSATSSPPS